MYIHLVRHKIAFACFNILSIQFLWAQLVHGEPPTNASDYSYIIIIVIGYFYKLCNKHIFITKALGVSFFLGLMVERDRTIWHHGTSIVFICCGGWQFQFDQKYFSPVLFHSWWYLLVHGKGSILAFLCVCAQFHLVNAVFKQQKSVSFK